MLTRNMAKVRVATIMLLLIGLVQGCTNSKLIIGPLYNRLDNQMRGEFNKLGDFDERQVAEFEARLGNYHVWHRQSELPEYANLMRSVAASIANSGTSKEDVQRWFDTAEAHSLLVRECHPVNFLFDFMKSLSDEELDFIEKRFEREQAKNRARYQERSPDERIESRLRNIEKWAGRINLEFTPTQRAMLLTAFKQQTSLRKEYYRLSGAWKKEFFTLARRQDNPGYDKAMSVHLDKFWRLLENEHPVEWQKNRNLWKTTVLRVVTSMTIEQRETVTQWMNKMAKTVDSISKDKPSFQYVHDPSLGCLINPEKT